MLRKLFPFLLLTLITGCSSDGQEVKKTEDTFMASSFSELVERINDIDTASRQEIVDFFLDTLETTPVIEGENDVFFIYSGMASSVSVAGDFTGWNPVGNDFTNISGTNLWYRKQTFESNARLDYKLVIDDSNWILDLKNPNRISGGFGPNSELAMPDYEQPWEIEEKEDVLKGNLIERSISSTNTGKTYSVKIYLPAGYDEGVDYPVAYFQDGNDYLNLANSTIVLDNLLDAKLIKPILGVFVQPNDRNVEYAFEDRFKYRDFFVQELVPYIDQEFSTLAQKEMRAVIGDSYGGNISAIISFTHPDVFGNCGIHSGAFQPNNFDTNNIVMDGIHKDIRVASVWGTYEGISLPPNMMKIKDYLLSTGYDVIWKDLPEGHSWGLWRATLDDMLIFFFPTD
ncbi:MAG: hypothetical protein GY816_18585 [Cytophagales bacterium]|nr:hypothetical protein [Cytophagales bacterium]